ADNTTGEKTVETGTYYVSENPNPPTNYTQSLACVDTANGNAPVSIGANNSVQVTTGSDIVCTFTNTEQGSITIIKKAVPQDPHAFTFTTAANLNVPGNQFVLDDDGSLQNPSATSNTKAFTSLVAGNTYTVTEAATTGWKLTALDCTGLGQGDSSNPNTG